MKYFKLKTNYNIPPCETLKELLEEQNINYKQLAKNICISDYIMLEILHNKIPINENLADKLEKALNIPASFWLKRQQNYNNYIKRDKK